MLLLSHIFTCHAPPAPASGHRCRVSALAGIENLIQRVFDERVGAINHSFADPTPYVAAAHAAGIKVFAQVQAVARAQRAARADVDVTIGRG